MASALPPPTPPGYQSPYYSPVPGQTVAPQRTSARLIIGIVGGLVLAMVAAMFLIGLLFVREAPQPVADHGSAPATPAPGSTTPEPTAGGAVKTTSFQVNAPGWKVLKQNSVSVTMLSPSGNGTLFIVGGTLNTHADTASWVAGYLSDVTRKYPDAKICMKPASESHGGKEGTIVGACYSYTPPTGPAFKAAHVIWAAVDSNNNLFMYEVFCDVKNFDTVYNNEVLPVVADSSLQWAA